MSTALKAAWEQCPEPDKQALSPDGRTVLDCDDADYAAYLWETHNCKEGWLAYDGELLPIEQ